MTAEMWAEIKRLERGYAREGGPVEVCLRPADRDRAPALEAELAELGARVLGRERGGAVWRVLLDPYRLPQAACSPLWADLSLQPDAGRRSSLRLLILGALALLLLAAVLGLSLWPPAVGERGGRDGGGDLYQTGLTAYRRGDKESALRCWRELVRRRPDRLGARRNLAWLLYELGRPREARREFMAILKARPGDPEAVSALEVIRKGEGVKPGSIPDTVP